MNKCTCHECTAAEEEEFRRIEEATRQFNDMMLKSDITAHGILESAQGHMEDRAATYDKPQGERSMAATVAAFKATTGIELSETNGWIFMCLLKIVRSRQGEYRADNFEDLAAYSCLAGESAAKESSE